MGSRIHVPRCQGFCTDITGWTCCTSRSTRSLSLSVAAAGWNCSEQFLERPKYPTVIIITMAGRTQLAKVAGAASASVEIRALKAEDSGIDPAVMVQFLRSELGVHILLHEEGPTLFGQFLAANVRKSSSTVLSPQIAGRAAHTVRPGIVQGVEFVPNTAPWLQLLRSKKRTTCICVTGAAQLE
jgi:riboflavin biosynthesis pyrimidine reductase